MDRDAASFISLKANTVQIKTSRMIAAGACALGLVLTLVPGLVQAQSTVAAAASSAAPAALPAITDVKPVDPSAAAARKAPDALDNPYGFEALWKTSDAVARTVLLLLLIMSVGSWYIMIVKVLEQAKMGRQAKAAARDFWSADTVEQGAAALEANSPFRFMAEAATTAVKKHEGLMGHIPLNDWIAMRIQRAVDRIQSNTQGGLAFLATVGSISPFVGLFGTVWGIYHALTAIGISGQASIDKVAGPVGEALLMTAIGLAVAVPAVLAYNWLVRRNKAVMDEVRAFSSDLHAVVLGSVVKT
ncbi:MAG: biopolymer transporter ExbB [Rhodoferax sp. RIFCSPLOWO2_12_FULL_60_11]|nr:MAG: biopolymer transporter ExbB [Rhodoferax sp. RIFCSPLOWO2_12_FULL_60_11]